MQILVVGAGSTGGYFGARLAQAGRDVTFLVRPARRDQLQSTGLRVTSPHGDLDIIPRLVTAPELQTRYDLVLLTVKAFALQAALDDIHPAIGDGSIILPVLNGMKHIDVLRARFGAAPVIGGVCRIAADLDATGRVIQLARFHDLVYGEFDGAISDRMRTLDAALQGCGFEARLSTTIEREMWEKWIFLAALGAATCLMRATIGEIIAAGGVSATRGLLAECIAIATQAGHPPSQDFVAAVTGQLTTPGSPLTSSMFRDLMKNQPVEVDQILADLLARAGGPGPDFPLLTAACAQLSAYKARLS